MNVPIPQADTLERQSGRSTGPSRHPEAARMLAALEAKDHVTHEHVVRVAALATRVGAELGLAGEDLWLLELGALLHDMGKLFVPDDVLNKPGRLDATEYDVVQHHPVVGARLIREIPALAIVAPIVRAHHEHLDGSGYPDGLIGDEIPFLARVVSVCDAFDAMANTRQYRVGLGPARAIAVLRDHAGLQWDSWIVEALVAVVARDAEQTSPGAQP